MKKGFTLIELLVVIAIIAILSALAVVSLSSARGKANDAKVKSDLAQIAIGADTSFTDNANYDGNWAEIVVNTVGSAPANCSSTTYVIATSTDGLSYVAYHSLCTDDAQIWCTDSSGFRGTTTADVMTVSGTGLKCQ